MCRRAQRRKIVPEEETETGFMRKEGKIFKRRAMTPG